MKKTKVLKGIGLFLCSLILFVGCSQNNAASSSNFIVENTKAEKKEVVPMQVEFETSEFSNDDYSTKYPAAWTVQPDSSIKGVQRFLIDDQNEDSDFVANATIQIFTYSKEVPSIDTYIEQLKKHSESQVEKSIDKVKKELNNSETVYSIKDFQIEKKALSCGEVAKIILSSTIDGCEVKQLQVHIINKNDKTKCAVISYGNSPQYFDKEVETIMYMADTFEFKK